MIQWLCCRGSFQLRRTCAARAIESGTQPKTLQKLLGHASLKMTIDRYVHVTDDSMEMGIRLFEQGQLENGLSTAEKTSAEMWREPF